MLPTQVENNRSGNNPVLGVGQVRPTGLRLTSCLPALLSHGLWVGPSLQEEGAQVLGDELRLCRPVAVGLQFPPRGVQAPEP